MYMQDIKITFSVSNEQNISYCDDEINSDNETWHDEDRDNEDDDEDGDNDDDDQDGDNEDYDEDGDKEDSDDCCEVSTFGKLIQ